MKQFKIKNPLSLSGLLFNPIAFWKRVFWTLLVQNKKHASTQNMIVVLFINLLLLLTEMTLAYFSLSGDPVIITLFALLMGSDIFIRFILIYLKSKSVIYAFFLSMYVLTWVIPIWNLYQNKIKPQFN